MGDLLTRYPTPATVEWESHGARYYNSEWGRFISPDPKREFHNQYSYCWDDPINIIDRDGRGGSGIDAKVPVLTSWGHDDPIAAWELDINLALQDELERQAYLAEVEAKEEIKQQQQQIEQLQQENEKQQQQIDDLIERVKALEEKASDSNRDIATRWATGAIGAYIGGHIGGVPGGVIGGGIGLLVGMGIVYASDHPANYDYYWNHISVPQLENQPLW